jgi:hypothetical protein
MADPDLSTKITKLKERIDYNSHHLGEWGNLIRVEYVFNFLDDFARELEKFDG